MTLLRWLIFLLRSVTVILTVLLFWIYFFLLMLVLVLQWLSLHWKFLIVDFPINSKRDASIHCIAFMTILVLIRMVFKIIWELFHGRISLSLVPLLLLVNFASEFRVELMYISLIENIRSSLTHLNVFQLLVLLSVHRNNLFLFVPTE